MCINIEIELTADYYNRVWLLLHSIVGFGQKDFQHSTFKLGQSQIKTCPQLGFCQITACPFRQYRSLPIWPHGIGNPVKESEKSYGGQV